MHNHRLRRVVLVTAGIALLAPALQACALIEGPPAPKPVRTLPAAPEVEPVFIPDGSAEENLPFFTETLRTYTLGDKPVTGEPISTTLIDAGFQKEQMQVSFDLSKTGLVADSIFVSVRIDADCLIGQVIEEDRSFAVEVADAVGPQNDICLIGETRSIIW